MTDKQIRTLSTLDIISNILATIQIMITILIVKFGTNNDMKMVFSFFAIICFFIICKSIFKTKEKRFA